MRDPDAAAARDLTARILSALVLIAAGFLVVFAGGWVYALWVAGIGLILSFEWSTLTGRAQRAPAAWVHGAGAAAAPLIAHAGGPQAAVALLVFIAIVAALCARRRFWSAAGVLYVLAPQIAFISLRDAPMQNGVGVEGLRLTIGLFFIVGMTDTASLVVGRTVKGPQLPIWISPGKTWAGLIGGVLVGASSGAIFAFFAAPDANAAVVWTVCVALACATQAGDLTESMLKRRFGIKDVGRLIPGHGGAMDRFDGALFAAPVAAAIWLAST